MKIASFNINGVKARLPALLDWLAAAKPDVVCLQEIKSQDHLFPREPIEDVLTTMMRRQRITASATGGDV